MKNTHILWKDNKGFTLINILFVMIILSITIVSLTNLFKFLTVNTNKEINKIKTDNSIDYFYNYLNSEFKNADRIIPSTEVKYYNNLFPKNLGFFLISEGDKKTELRYTNYYLRSDGALMRNSRSFSEKIKPDGRYFRSKQGDFSIVENIDSLSYEMSLGNSNLYELELTFKNEEINTFYFDLRYLVVEDE